MLVAAAHHHSLEIPAMATGQSDGAKKRNMFQRNMFHRATVRWVNQQFRGSLPSRPVRQQSTPASDSAWPNKPYPESAWRMGSQHLNLGVFVQLLVQGRAQLLQLTLLQIFP